MSRVISSIVVPAVTKPAKSAIIFVHGLGDSGQGWSWLPQLVKQSNKVKSSDSINYVFPNAPELPITANGGYVMPAWFDIIEFGNPKGRQDIEGHLKSCAVLKELVKEQIEVNNIPAERIIIGGFSQGAALALSTLALLDLKIGGVVALSGFCPIKDIIEKDQNSSGINLDTPIFQGHGTADPVINYDFGKMTADFYKSLGFSKLQFNTYPGVAHSADDKELADAFEFMSSILDK